ncbi:MAG: STAS/SEC14 domain-containing protein [Proteobacteria bacterium]|nr:STAS/SEC14 domain-containing protein [Pseudomonadota bacterium]
MFRKIPETPAGTAGFRLEGKLSREDYRRFSSVLEKSLKESNGLSVLLDLRDFQGLDMRFGLLDLARGRKYNQKLKRLAVLDDGPWADYFTQKASLFLKGRVRAFPPSREQEAWEWLGKDPSS